MIEKRTLQYLTCSSEIVRNYFSISLVTSKTLGLPCLPKVLRMRPNFLALDAAFIASLLALNMASIS